MSPVFTRDHALNRTTMPACPAGDRANTFPRCMGRSHLTNNLTIQLGLWVLLTQRDVGTESLSALGPHIKNVILATAKKKVAVRAIISDTVANIALMQYGYPFWNRAIRQDPCNAMYLDLAATRYAHDSVSKNCASCPKPTAAFRLEDLFPEAFNQGACYFPIAAVPQDKVSLPAGVLRDWEDLVTSASAEAYRVCARIGLHADPPTQDWCATPVGVSAPRGHSCAHYSIWAGGS